MKRHVRQPAGANVAQRFDRVVGNPWILVKTDSAEGCDCSARLLCSPLIFGGTNVVLRNRFYHTGSGLAMIYGRSITVADPVFPIATSAKRMSRSIPIRVEVLTYARGMTMISTRRFLRRPSGDSLLAIGSVSARPTTLSCFRLIPMLISCRATEIAREADRCQFVGN